MLTFTVSCNPYTTNYNSSYKSRLQQLHMLPLMYIYELNDIMFLVKSLKSPTDNFDIKNYITFASNSTRSGAYKKLAHPMISNATQHHFYFNRIIRLHNYLPVINLSLPINIIKKTDNRTFMEPILYQFQF